VAAAVGPEHGGQDRRDRDHPDGPVRAVLQAAMFMTVAIAGPRGSEGILFTL
jgi:hypothetical protein